MTDLHELYATLLPQHDLDAQKGLVPTIDYRSLLERYIDHVRVLEGETFIGPSFWFEGTFTRREWAELVAMSDRSHGNAGEVPAVAAPCSHRNTTDWLGQCAFCEDGPGGR